MWNAKPSLVLFALTLTGIVLDSGCANNVAKPARLPLWLTQNVTLIETSMEGTVLIDAAPMKDGDKHHGGIGIVLDARHVLVPAHSVKGAKSVAVHPRSFYVEIPGYIPGDAYGGKIVAVDESQDSALFETDVALPNRPLKFDPARHPVTGEHVWYFGKVHGFQPCKVSHPSVVAGTLTDAIQVAIEATYGDSGAPLVTDDGVVLGMLHGTSTDGQRTYFVPIDKALASVGRR